MTKQIASTRRNSRSERSRTPQVDQRDPRQLHKTSTYRDKLESQGYDSYKAFRVDPKTENQNLLLEAIPEYDIVVALGPAGTGKTYCSVGKVVELYNKGHYKKIVIARSIIPTGKSMGYLPGDLKEKMIPWLLPMLSVMEKAFGKQKFDIMMAKDDISIQPLETIRGRSFEDSLILIDEAQNLSFEEIKAITTRLGENSKMVLMGDAFQSDLQGKSALLTFCAMCARHNIEIPVIQFGLDDIVRSDIVGKLVRMFVMEHKE